MKNAIILIFSIVLFYACGSSKQVIIEDALIKKEIDTLLVSWHQAATDADFKAYFGLIDTDAFYIGTAAEEIWTKKQFAGFSKPYFDAGKAWSFTTLERSIYLNSTGDFAWFDELIATWMGTCRGSGVLEKTKNGWMLKQYVLSMAIPNEDVQKIIQIKKKNDAVFLEKYKK